jgi:hypothetical protein
VNALEITEAVQVVEPPRWSETVTVPSWPLIVLELTVEAACVPSETLAVGALIDSVPAVVKVKVAGVIAAAESAVAAATVAQAMATSKNFRMV